MKQIFDKIKQLSIGNYLSFLAFLVVSFTLCLYFIGKVKNYASIIRIFDSQGNQLLWLLIIFVILCHLDYLRELIRSVVREKMDSLVISEIQDQLVETISNDPDILTKLEAAREKKTKGTLLPEKEANNINLTKDNE